MSNRLTRMRASVAAIAILGALAVGAGVAGADGIGLTNVQANNPQVLSGSELFPRNKQNEPTIAVDPAAQNILLAGSNDEQLEPVCNGTDCSFAANVGSDGLYVSTNGGSSWANEGLLPGFTDPSGEGTYVSDGDPGIVFGPHGSGQRAYYVGLASYATGQAKGNQAPELITVSHSDGGSSGTDFSLGNWSSPVVAATGHGYKFNDKPAIWADPNSGTVYVSWTQFRDIPGCAEPIMVSYSTDGGDTWSRPNQITAAHNCSPALGGRQGSVIRTDSAGNAYLFWEDSDRTGSIIAFAVSHDGGRKWSHPRKVASLTDIADPIPGANFRTDSFPSVAIDQSSGTIYVAYADATSGNGRIVVTTSSDGGADWSSPKAVSNDANGYAFFQGLDVAPNGRVDLAWQQLTTSDPSTYGTGNASIDSYYSYSSNSGSSWTSPEKVSTASSDPAASAQNDLTRQFWGDYNTLVSTNDSAFFIYTDSRNGSGCTAVDQYQQGLADKPAPGSDCPPNFGNTDVYVSAITP